MKVRISRLHFPVTTLGPGHRVGLWFQGCSIRCPGCVSLDTWADDGPLTETAEVLDALRRHLSRCDGLTVSGGEPFDQPDALSAVLGGWRAMGGGDVLVFTGRELEDVEPWLETHSGLVDALMTGPFRSDLPATRLMRGSDNQQLHVFGEAGGRFAAYDRPSSPSDRRLDVAFEPDGTAWFAGIPARGDLARLRRVLRAGGHHMETSDMVGSVRA